MKTNNSKLAFSLIELSVVILIIGILLIGITKGSRIIKTVRLNAAQQLTINSPVNAIDGIVIWLETTLSKSLIDSEVIDNVVGGTGQLLPGKTLIHKPYPQITPLVLEQIK